MQLKKYTSADIRKPSVMALFSLIITLIITLLSVIIAFHPDYSTHARAQSGNWFDPNWQYRLPVTVDNSSNANNLTNYQDAVSLSSTNFDFTKAQTNGNDLRFTDTDGTTLINYWIETYNSTKKAAKIWVNVPTIPANAQKIIYMYFGNPAASSASNGKSTFNFFDDFSDPAWQQLPNMPVQAADTTAGAPVNNIFYIIGGYNNTATNPLNTVYAFDPSTNTYTQKANMPTARWGMLAVPFNGQIYVFGGFTGGGGSSSTKNQVYNPATNSWTTKSPLPASIAWEGITGCTDGSKIYLFYQNQGYAYDPTQDTYTQISDTPLQYGNWGTCAYYNGKIYLINGLTNPDRQDVTNNVQIYKIATDSWTTGAPSPFALYGSIRENPILNDNIYIVQGQRNPGEFSSAVYVYNITNNTWTEKSLGPHAADGVTGGFLNGKLYTFGGRQDTQGPFGINYAAVYTPSLDTTPAWQQVTAGFEIRNRKLVMINTPRGALPYIEPQIQSLNYQTSGSFILNTLEDLSSTPATTNWSTVAIDADGGSIDNNLHAYLAPYNDFGVSPSQASIFKENGTSYTELDSSTDISSGTYPFEVVRSPTGVSVYKNGAPYLNTNDSTYTSGHVDVISNTNSPTAWDYLFTRQYTSPEPTITVGSLNSTPTPTPTPATPTPTPTPAMNYLYTKLITIDHTKVTGGANLTNFPVLISMTDPDLKTAANGGFVQNSNGYDISFMDSTGTTKLDHEIERYVPTTGEIDMWVRIPTLSATADTVISMFFDNSSITSSQENKTGVWDSNYRGVWHLKETSGNQNDSTSNGNNISTVNVTKEGTATGQIDGADQFNGTSDYASVPLDLSGTKVITVSFWLNWTAFANNDQLAMEFTPNYNNSTGGFLIDPNSGSWPGNFEISLKGDAAGYNDWNISRPSAGAWHYYTVVLDKSQPAASEVTVYLDGSQPSATQVLNANNTNNFANSTLYFMSRAGASLFGTGTLDETRISNTTRSAGWIATEYNNQNSPATFYTVGSRTSR
jgi:hypothetical protein